MSEAETPKQQNPEETAVSEANADLTVQVVDTSAPSQPEATPISRFKQRIAPETAEVSSAESAKDPGSLPPLQEADWFSLARKLRQRNRDLLKKVASLEQALAESQEALQAEIARSRSIEAIGTQQAKELNLSQGKISALLEELEISRQDAHRQKVSIARLSEQVEYSRERVLELERSRERILELERDCAHLQQQYEEQTDRLQEAQQQSRELYVRLQRQQRQTLQFKAALDKCLDTQSSQMMRPSSSEEESVQEAEIAPTPLTIVAQPIQPWSSQPDPSAELSGQSPAWATNRWQEGDPIDEFYLDDAAIAEQMALFDLTPDDPAGNLESDWEKALDPAHPEYNAVDWMLDAIDVPVSEESGSTEREDVSEATSELEAESLEPLESDRNLASEEPVETPSVQSEEQAQATDEPSPQWQHLYQEQVSPVSTSPSPLLYPRRPHIRRKTFASIELPNFPRCNPSRT